MTKALRRGPAFPGLVCSLFLVLVHLGTPPAASGETPELTIGTSLWPPYVDPRLPGQGLALSIVTAAFERAGYQVGVELDEDWGRTLEKGRSGEFAVIAAAWKARDRERDFLFSEPYLENKIKFLKRRAEELTINGLEDLRGLRVGVVFGYAYGDAFDAFDASADFVRVPETHVLGNLLELLADRVDVVVGDERTLRFEIARHLHDRRLELELLPRALDRRSLHVAVSRRHPQAAQLVSDFNAAMGTLRDDGTYRKLSRQANEEIWRQSYLPN